MRQALVKEKTRYLGLKRYGLLLFLLTFANMANLCFNSVIASASPEYSARTGRSCAACHVTPQGGALSEKGLAYAASGYVWSPEGDYRALGPVRKPVRFAMGFFHILAAFMWFGTILYVHILLKPGYASKGLPRGEVLLGLLSMAVVGVTGVLLTISRVKSLEVLYTTRWGGLLLAKIIIYAVMVSSAAVIVTKVGPKLRRGFKGRKVPADGVFGPQTLAGFDGRVGSPAYIAFKGTVYDVSGLSSWKDGAHMKLHNCGQDLTDALSRAPHEEDRLKGLRAVGTYDASFSPPKTTAQKAFYFVAYMNLALVFIVLFIIATWRWGI